MPGPATPWTYEDYVDFPDDGRRYEIVDGDQDILGRPFCRIADHIERHGGGRAFLGPLDVVLSPTDVVKPDVLFVADADTH